MKSYLLPFVVLLALSVQSCFVADTLFLEPEPKLTLPFDVVVKDSVYQYIQRTKSADERYLSYGYEPFKVIVPEAIKEREKWEERKGQTGFSNELVTQKIAYYDSIIAARNLSRKIAIEHTFSLRSSKDSIASVQKANFILSNNLQVIDLMPRYQAELSEAEEKLFAKYYYEAAIIKAYSFEESQRLSREFYRFFKEEWYNKQTTFESGQFLKHTLKVINDVDIDNLFNVQRVAQNILIDYFKTNRPEIEGYQVINFSPLYEINEDEELTGYYFFHTFSYQIEDKTELLSVYVKFNPFYEVERVVETDQKYDVYGD